MKTFEHLDKKIFLCAKEFLACPKKIFFLSEGNICSYLRETFSACTKEIFFRPNENIFYSLKEKNLPKRGKRFPVGGESGENVCVFVSDKDLFAFQGERGL